MSTKQPLTQKQRESQVAEFMGTYTWEGIYNIWSRRLDELSVPFQPLFQLAEIIVPAQFSARPFNLVWWPRSEYKDQLRRCQEHFKKYPQTQGPTHPDGFPNKGELQTLHLMHALQGSAEKQAAVLMSASLFARLDGRGAHCPDYWPPALCVRALAKLVDAIWRDDQAYWHRMSRWVLPVNVDDYAYRIDGLAALVRYLAEEHAALLHQQVPIQVVFSSSRAPHLRGL